MSAFCDYGTKIPALVERGNVFGAQFHPEKSGRRGAHHTEKLREAGQMIIFPAIDIKDGSCVRLFKGDFGTVEKVAEDPLETARSFEAAGRLLDSHGGPGRGQGRRSPETRRSFFDVVRNTVLTGGGGRRHPLPWTRWRTYLSGGVQRVILGSAAVKNPALVQEAVREYGGRIAVGIDAKNGMVAVRGLAGRQQRPLSGPGQGHGGRPGSGPSSTPTFPGTGP